MPVPTESVIDEDVYGDGTMAGLTNAFDSEQGVEDDFSLMYDFDQDRLAYIVNCQVPLSIHRLWKRKLPQHTARRSGTS